MKICPKIRDVCRENEGAGSEHRKMVRIEIRVFGLNSCSVAKCVSEDGTIRSGRGVRKKDVVPLLFSDVGRTLEDP